MCHVKVSVHVVKTFASLGKPKCHQRLLELLVLVQVRHHIAAFEAFHKDETNPLVAKDVVDLHN